MGSTGFPSTRARNGEGRRRVARRRGPDGLPAATKSDFPARIVAGVRTTSGSRPVVGTLVPVSATFAVAGVGHGAHSAATTGVPAGAMMSSPSWRPPDLYPNPEETVPLTGQRNFFAEILSWGIPEGRDAQPAASDAASRNATPAVRRLNREIRACR